MSHAALEHTIPFLKHLSQQFYTPESEASRSIAGGTAVLRKFWDEWSNQVEDTQRQALSA
jgi:hypothetical protein